MIKKSLDEVAKIAPVPNGYGCKNVVGKRKCSWCNQEYEIREHDLEYIVKLKGKIYHFCSWSHKCRFSDLHEEELRKERDKTEWVSVFEEQRKKRYKKHNDNLKLKNMEKLKAKYPSVNMMLEKDFERSLVKQGEKYIIFQTTMYLVINEKGEERSIYGFNNSLKWLGVEVKE